MSLSVKTYISENRQVQKLRGPQAADVITATKENRHDNRKYLCETDKLEYKQ